MEEQFIAHISDSGKVQSVAEHSLNTAAAAAEFSIAELRQMRRRSSWSIAGGRPPSYTSCAPAKSTTFRPT